MGWLTGDGRHEGYLAPMFGDGQRGRSVTGGSVPPDEVVVGVETQGADGSWVWPTRPAGEVTGWVVCCDCYRNTSFGPASSWVGPVFTQVPSKTLEDLAARRVFAADDDVVYVSEREDVRAAAVGLWRSEHAFGIDALTEVEAASAAVSQAKLRLDAAVALARNSDASWADIGRATGMTRQSAQERWRSADGPPPAAEHEPRSAQAASSNTACRPDRVAEVALTERSSPFIPATEVRQGR